MHRLPFFALMSVTGIRSVTLMRASFLFGAMLAFLLLFPRGVIISS